jgi:hypothetical protein
MEKDKILSEIQHLQQELERVKKENSMHWLQYGSELAAGGMSESQNKLETSINELKKLL